MAPSWQETGRRICGAQPLTTTVCAAEMPSTTRSTSVGHRPLDDRQRHRAVLVVPRHRGEPTHLALAERAPATRHRAARGPTRRGAGRPGGAAAGRGCAPGRSSPGRGSSPCAGAPRCAASRPRAGWCGGRSRSPSRGRHAATRSASAAQVPASGRSPTAASSSPRGTISSRQRAARGRVALDRPVGRGVTDQPGPRVDPGQRLALDGLRSRSGSPSTA